MITLITDSSNNRAFEADGFSNEHAVIGCMVLSDECASKALHILSVEDFTGELSKEMFIELKKIYEQYNKIDEFIVAQSPNSNNLILCAQKLQSISNFDIYVQRIKEHRIKSEAKKIALWIIDNDFTVDEIAEKAEEIARLTSGRKQDTKTVTMSALLVDFMTEHKYGEKPEYLHFGLGLDKFVRIRRGNYVVIGARPSTGKTAFSIQIAMNLARERKKVLYCSLETKNMAIIERAISCHGRFKFEDIQNNQIDWNDIENCKELEKMAQLPIGINDKINNPAIIEAVACAGNYDAIFIDYMSLLELGRKTNNIYERVTETSIALHKMAQKNNLLVVALCQLNRAGVGAPRLEHLRESGQIEQDADVVMMLHNEIIDDEYGNTKEKFAIIVEKNKTGRCGKMPLDYNKEEQHFYEIDNREETL